MNRIVESLKDEAAERRRRMNSLHLTNNTNGEESESDSTFLVDDEIPALRLAAQVVDSNLSSYKLSDLLAFEDIEFLHNAYQAILKRPPDPAGLTNAIWSLRSGHTDKLALLVQLRFSEEGREKGVKIRGLRRHTLIRSFYQLPILGYLASPLYAYLKVQSSMRDQRGAMRLVLDRQDSIVSYVNESLRTPLRETARTMRATLNLLSEQKRTSEAILERIGNLTKHLEDRVNEEAIQRQQEFKDRTAEIEDLRRVYNKYRTQVELTEKALKQEMDHLFRKHQEVKTELVYHQQQLGSITNNQPISSASSESISSASSRNVHLDSFFASFDEHFRGNREDVKQRLSIYLPIIRRYGVGTDEAPILDVACGRGEWLELLKEENLRATGVDVNSVLVSQCRDRGLEVAQSDLIDYLRSIPDAGLGAVSAFHIAEHLPLERLIQFLDEALRALRSGGVIIMETPNPQNIMVGSCNFYFDPTHRNPLPAPVLRFIAESRGFIVLDTICLNPSDEKPVQADSEVAARFNDYFYGPMDYAIVARKV